MPVYDASYRPWPGKARATRLVIFAIASTMIRRLFRLRTVRFLVIVMPLVACSLASIFFYTSHEELFEQVTRRLGLSDFSVFHWVNQQFLVHIRIFAVLLAALTGAPLIAEDRRARALPLYFSRPLTHFDYVAGKLLTVAVFLAALLLLPPLCMYVVRSMISPAEDAWTSELSSLGCSLVPGLLLTVTLSSISLAASSLCRRRTFAAFLCLAIFMVAPLIGEILAGILQEPAWRMISPLAPVLPITHGLLPLPNELVPFQIERVAGVPLETAWFSLAAWTGLSLLVLTARIRRVEVVT